MNCKRCHHVRQIHEESRNDSFLKLGKCAIPGCPCSQFVESIDQLDEDLM